MYRQRCTKFWPGVEKDEKDEEALKEEELTKGYAFGQAIPNSPADANLVLDFRTDDLGHADEMIENTRGLQEPCIPRERISLNTGTRFGYAAGVEGEISKANVRSLGEEEEAAVDAHFDAEDPSISIGWPSAPVVTLSPTGVTKQFARLATQDIDIEEWSENIIPYPDEEEELGEEEKVTRMRMVDHDMEREYQVDFDAQSNMPFSFDQEKETVKSKLMKKVLKPRSWADFLPGVEHLAKPFVRSVFVNHRGLDLTQTPISTKENQDVLDMIDAYLDPDMVVDNSEDECEFVDITQAIHQGLEMSSVSSVHSRGVVPKLSHHNDLPPVFEHITNPTFRPVFDGHQPNLSAQNAGEEDEHDILDITDAYLDPDMLFDMSEDDELTEMTHIIRPTTFSYNVDVQQDVRCEEEGPKTHHLESASGILQGAPVVEDWSFDNIIRQCDYDMYSDVLKSAFSD
jgi:hypothetical protein